MSDTWFGRPYPKGAKCAWGARAIIDSQDGGLDFVPDRQQWMRLPSDPFKQWLGAMKAELREHVKLNWRSMISTPDQTAWIGHDKTGQFHVEASAQGSFGYMYIVAWEE